MRVCFINFIPYQWTRPYLPPLKLTYIAPENGWLEYDLASFSGVSRPIFRCFGWLFVSGEGRVPNLGNQSHWIPGKPMVLSFKVRRFSGAKVSIWRIFATPAAVLSDMAFGVWRFSGRDGWQLNGKRTLPKKRWDFMIVGWFMGIIPILGSKQFPKEQQITSFFGHCPLWWNAKNNWGWLWCDGCFVDDFFAVAFRDIFRLLYMFCLFCGDIPSMQLENITWKWMIGRRSFPFRMAS